MAIGSDVTEVATRIANGFWFSVENSDGYYKTPTFATDPAGEPLSVGGVDQQPAVSGVPAGDGGSSPAERLGRTVGSVGRCLATGTRWAASQHD